jgi:hypothetical protein
MSERKIQYGVIAITVVSLIFFFILVPLKSKEEKFDSPTAVSKTIVEPEILETVKEPIIKVMTAEDKIAYRNKIITIFNNYLQLQETELLTKERISKIKTELIDLIVPPEYKDLHLSFFLALNEMEAYFIAPKAQLKKDSQKIITEIQKDYPWLIRKETIIKK